MKDTCEERPPVPLKRTVVNMGYSDCQNMCACGICIKMSKTRRAERSKQAVSGTQSKICEGVGCCILKYAGCMDDHPQS